MMQLCRIKKPKNPKNMIRVAILIVLLGLTSWLLYGRVLDRTATDENANGSVEVQASKPGSKDDPGRIRMLATGDWIAHDSVNSAAKTAEGKYDYLPQVADFKDIFQKSDIRFCNDPILNAGDKLGISGYPKFNSPSAFVADMGRLGCNLVSTASNHSFDFTQSSIDASVDAWDKVPNMLAVTGQNRTQEEQDRINYFEVKGVKFAFLAYTTYSNAPPQNSYGVNMYSDDVAAAQIAVAKQNGAQFIVVSMRWGTEYSSTVSAIQKRQAQFLANNGVDLVLGHGPHVLQTVEELSGAGQNKTQVWYSLGNFLNTQIPSESLFNGLPVLDIDTKTKQIKIVGFLPIYMHYKWTAEEAADEKLSSRKDVKLYLLEDATQAMINAQQLKTTVTAQKQRMKSVLSAGGLSIPLITAEQLND